jgi:hypothetical protein
LFYGLHFQKLPGSAAILAAAFGILPNARMREAHGKNRNLSSK